MGAICELPLELLIYELNLAIVSEKPQKDLMATFCGNSPNAK